MLMKIFDSIINVTLQDSYFSSFTTTQQLFLKMVPSKRITWNSVLQKNRSRLCGKAVSWGLEQPLIFFKLVVLIQRGNFYFLYILRESF